MSKKAVDNKKIIMVFGTFDGLHEGHANFFRQARSLASGASLVVSIARDVNVKRIKGKVPDLSEEKRLILVEESGLADKVVLAGVRNYLPHILKEKPDIIALGYDQMEYIRELKKDLKNKKILVQIARLKPYKEKIYKNHLLKKKKLI